MKYSDLERRTFRMFAEGVSMKDACAITGMQYKRSLFHTARKIMKSNTPLGRAMRQASTARQRCKEEFNIAPRAPEKTAALNLLLDGKQFDEICHQAKITPHDFRILLRSAARTKGRRRGMASAILADLRKKEQRKGKGKKPFKWHNPATPEEEERRRSRRKSAMAAFEPPEGKELPRLEDLKMRQCHWPYDAPDGGIVFCGERTDAPGEVYCPDHKRISKASGGHIPISPD